MNYVVLLFNIEGVFIYRNKEIIQFSKHVHIGTKIVGSNNLKILDHLK